MVRDDNYEIMNTIAREREGGGIVKIGRVMNVLARYIVRREN